MLSTKYRPHEFGDVVGQPEIVKILQNQIKNKTYSQAIIFVGSAGCGKTTCARILANEINGEIFEFDCASHNGVADVKEIMNIAKTPSLIHDYKCIILDECHTLSSAAWSSMLITLEEKLNNTIFIFCTTDPQKIPNTIFSRAQRFNFRPITDETIQNRLKVICSIENLNVPDESLRSIAHNAKGSMRQALTDLDKCIFYGEFDIDSVRTVLNIVSDNLMEDVYNAILNNDYKSIIDLVNSVYDNGYELHGFVRQLLDYCIDNSKEISVIDLIMTLINEIRYDDCPKNLIIARFLTYKRG